MKKEQYTPSARRWLLAGLGCVALLGANAQAILLEEHFTGGASTTGFTIVPGAGTVCNWGYSPAPGVTPTGAGFDGDFAYINSDACGTQRGIVVNSYLTSPPFNASGPGELILSFSHQFRALTSSFARVEVYNGSVWTQVANYTTTSVGYPNPATTAEIDITAAAGGSTAAQVRFRFNSDWDWWWAVDNIIVASAPCSAPGGLAVSNVTSSGAVIGFTPNGNLSYEWVVTNGQFPGTGGDIVTGIASGGVAAGLTPNTPYTVFVRSMCNGGGESLWSGGVSFTTLAVPPANDECSGAIALTVNPDYTCAATTPGTIAGATGSGVTSTCFGSADDDVWFSFVATGTSHRIVLGDVTGSTTDLYHALWRGTCAGLELVPGSCSDPNTSNPTGLSVGTTYYVQVYTWTATAGQNTSFSVCIGTPPPPPANDDCGGAIALTVNPDLDCGVTTSGTITSATASGVTSTCFGTADDDVWFSFVATGTRHRIELLNVAGSTTDLYHALWRGTCAGLELVPGSCSDPNTSNPANLTVGTTYYVQVYTYTATVGQSTTFSVCIGTPPPPPPPPANDDCGGAIALTVNPDFNCGVTTPGTIAGATASGVTSTCGGTADDDVWFSFVATGTTHRIVLGDIAGSITDLYHAVWRGTCNGLVLVPGSCSDPNTSNPTGLSAGTTYYVQVYTYTATAGQNTTFSVCVGVPPPPPANDDCAGAIALTVNPDYSCAIVTAGTTQSATASVQPDVDSGTPNDDVWFSFVATDAIHRVSLLNVSGSTDMGHSIYRALPDPCAPTGMTLVLTSDPNSSEPSGLIIGDTYYVRVYSWGAAATGANFDICVSTRVPAINDVCTAAVPLTVNTNYDCAARTWGTVFGATASNVTSTCGGTADDDVWFSFTALAATHRIVLGDVSGSTTDLYHALWRGTCDGLELVPNSCSDANTSNPTGLEPDTTYYVQVYTYTSTAGQNTSFSVCIGSDPSIGIGIGESVMGANMRVYPNPAQDQITFDVNDANVQRVRMVDAAGRHVLDAPFTRVLNVASLEAGAYTALLFDRNGAVIARSRFVKE